MSGVTNVPPPVNEPILSYAPGTPARATLKAELARLSGEVADIPAIVNGKEIRSGDVIEVFNTRGSIQAWAKVADAQRPGAVTLPEGWWPRQFARGKGVNELTSSAVNPIHEARFVGNMWSPSTGWKDCRCDVRKVAASA